MAHAHAHLSEVTPSSCVNPFCDPVPFLYLRPVILLAFEQRLYGILSERLKDRSAEIVNLKVRVGRAFVPQGTVISPAPALALVSRQPSLPACSDGVRQRRAEVARAPHRSGCDVRGTEFLHAWVSELRHFVVATHGVVKQGRRGISSK